LYRGEFLAGFTLPDSHPFEWWLLEEQERYHRRALNVLRLLAADRERAGDFAGAALWARKKIGLEPWRESAHRQAMRALALNGQRQAALAQYERCRHILAEELGVAPSARTQQLYRQIRDGDLLSPHPAAIPANPGWGSTWQRHALDSIPHTHTF
jgi:DNA-binding SARP family transcriptional activator